MGIRSKPFEGVVLSGPDIKKFEKQIGRAKPSKAAYDTVTRGLKMLDHASRSGAETFYRIGALKKG